MSSREHNKKLLAEIVEEEKNLKIAWLEYEVKRLHANEAQHKLEKVMERIENKLVEFSK